MTKKESEEQQQKAVVSSVYWMSRMLSIPVVQFNNEKQQQ